MKTRIFSRTTAAVFVFSLLLSITPFRPVHARADSPAGFQAGTWMCPRKDARNQARADVSGTMTNAPTEVWSMPTGGNVHFAREIGTENGKAVLVLVGGNLELRRWTGEPIWQQRKLGVTRVLHIRDFARSGREEVMVQTNDRTVMLLDLLTGRPVWTWELKPSTRFLSDGCKFIKTRTGVRFFAFLQDVQEGFCYDFSGNLSSPKLLWHRDYSEKYDHGYGPVIILRDMDGDGEDDIVLSSKAGRHQVYHAVIDTNTGNIKFDITYTFPGGLIGRPYGLLMTQDIDHDTYPDLLMASCQVEEYATVVRNLEGKGFEHVWGQFIEKDWPEDHRELRPQPTSLSDIQGIYGNEKHELVVGLWDHGMWRTLIIDPLKGFSEPRGDLKGYYFWGCHDLTADSVPEIIVSQESHRTPQRITTLVAFSGKTLRPIGELRDACIFTSGDSPLGIQKTFTAQRRNAVALATPEAMTGILVRRFQGNEEVGLFLWGGKPDGDLQAVHVAGPDFVRADLHRNLMLLTDNTGAIHKFRRNLKDMGDTLPCNGRICTPLLRPTKDGRELVVDLAGDRVAGITPDMDGGNAYKQNWLIRGSLPAAHVDAHGVSRLAVADASDPIHPCVRLYAGDMTSGQEPLRISLSHPAYLALTPFGDQFRLLVNLQKGVHTMGLAVYDTQGELLWSDPDKGAHPRPPAAGDLDGDGKSEVVADDHGVLRIYGNDGTITASNTVWETAYSLPIIGHFSKDSKSAGIYRAAGYDGISMINASGNRLWYRKAGEWNYYKSLPAVADVAGDGSLMLGALDQKGLLECIEPTSGKTRWSIQLSAIPLNTSVVSGDLNGDGKDEFLVGLPDGTLTCIGEKDREGAILWQKTFDSSVANPIIADIDGDGKAEIVLSTSDGYVRILANK